MYKVCYMFRRLFATFKEMMTQTNLYKHKVHCFWVSNPLLSSANLNELQGVDPL
jgi:hypothetical protein